MGLVALLAVGFAVVTRPVGAAAAGGCQAVTLPVALAPGLPSNQTIAGTLCQPPSYPGQVRRVDVLVHGATYNRAYWDWPLDYPQYSFVKRTLDAKRATFTYDRFGAGASSRPLSVLVTPEAEAYLLAQVITWLRTSQTMAVVDVIGHSLGSMIAVDEAANFGGVDRLVLTGYLNVSGPATLNVTDLGPAALDPQFFGQGYDLGYLTSHPGTRGTLFYYWTADPAVISYDEAHKDVVSSTLFAAALAGLYAPPPLNSSDRVQAPVLVVDGEYDRIYCGLLLTCTDAAAVRAYEAPFFACAASLTVSIIPDTGHNLALHPSAPQSFAAIDAWLTG